MADIQTRVSLTLKPPAEIAPTRQPMQYDDVQAVLGMIIEF